MNAWSVFSVQSTISTRYQESQLSLVVTLWLSGVVIDRKFTPGSVDVRARLFVDHHCVNVFIRVLNFRSWSQPRNYFNSEIFPIYGKLISS